MTKQLHFHFSSKEQAAFNVNVAVTVRSDFEAKKIMTSLFAFCPNLFAMRGFLVAQLIKSLPAMKEILVRFLGQEDPLGK